jgi:hypothetical protein
VKENPDGNDIKPKSWRVVSFVARALGSRCAPVERDFEQSLCPPFDSKLVSAAVEPIRPAKLLSSRQLDAPEISRRHRRSSPGECMRVLGGIISSRHGRPA